MAKINKQAEVTAAPQNFWTRIFKDEKNIYIFQSSTGGSQKANLIQLHEQVALWKSQSKKKSLICDSMSLWLLLVKKEPLQNQLKFP